MLQKDVERLVEIARIAAQVFGSIQADLEDACIFTDPDIKKGMLESAAILEVQLTMCLEPFEEVTEGA